ncbi:MAG TPA: tyrosine-type recombinase/integrase [Herpetosiphonaceae bacterium]|nr:tyrosine-type recombinase/integrase [Herpetosiphonaceae bacterium]
MTDLVPRTTDTAISQIASTSADRNPAAVYLSRLGRGSRRTMEQALHTIAELIARDQYDAFTLPWAALEYQHTQAVRTALAEGYSPATANKMLSALRGVLKEAWRLGQMSAEAHDRATDLDGIKSSTLPRGRALSPGEIAALLRVCAEDPSPAGARDAGAIVMMGSAGLRRSEVVALELTDYDPVTHAVRVRGGKGSKDRETYLGSSAALTLDDWLQVRGTPAGPLFCPVGKGGRITVRPMTAQSLMEALQKRAKQASVPHFSPHDLRRTFISHLLDAGADISTVQRLAGHANVQTTTRYDRRGEEAKRNASDLLHVPHYPRRSSR